MSIIRNGLLSADLDVPVVLPTLNLDFANSQSLDERITFSRGSIGTRVNRNGLIETIAANVPRFDFDPISGECRGLLIEETRTNLLLRSEDFGDAAWLKTRSSVLTDQFLSPTGLLTGDKLIENIQKSATHYCYFPVLSISSNTTYTFSIFLKLAERTFAAIEIADRNNPSNSCRVGINLSSGTLGTPFNIGTASGAASTITAYGNGWYRVSISGIIDTSSTAMNCIVYTATSVISSGFPSTNGDGTSGIYLWGAQLETGAFPTSYIPTTASTVTRSADNASMTGTNFSSWYNSTEGSLFVSARVNVLGSPGYPGIAYVDDGTVNNCIGFYVNDAVSDGIGAESYISGRAQYNLFSSSATTANKLNKVISSYSVNNFSAAFNTSSQVQRDTSGSIPTVNRLRIGALRGGLYPLNGTISRLTYYPKALSPSQLQYLTQ